MTPEERQERIDLVREAKIRAYDMCLHVVEGTYTHGVAAMREQIIEAIRALRDYEARPRGDAK